MPVAQRGVVHAQASYGIGAALVLGVVSSAHCFAMCGPLACAAQGGDPRGKWRRAWLYQSSRVLAYAALGAVLGAVGHGTARFASLPVERALPWVLAALLVITAIVPRGRLIAPTPLPGVGAVLARCRREAARLSLPARAVLFGALTPLLPCGLVYGMAVTALASGSASGGASLLAAFACGAIPALVAAQWGMARISSRLPAEWVSRGLPLVAAAVLVLRASRIFGAASCH